MGTKRAERHRAALRVAQLPLAPAAFSRRRILDARFAGERSASATAIPGT
jgi:hypothetical protein